MFNLPVRCHPNSHYLGPLTLAQESGGIDLLFHTNTESGKTDDLASDSAINIAFLNSSGEWASVSGTATVSTDRELVRKYYSPALKAWLGDLGDGTHDGGPEDPRIGIIGVRAQTATYAITGQTVVGRTVEIAKGIVTGESPKVNKLRELSEGELEECEFSCPMRGDIMWPLMPVFMFCDVPGTVLRSIILF